MPKFPSLIAAVVLSSVFPARSQELPEGKGKEMVAAQCTTCHAFRAGSGYTATGWNTVMRMMTNHGAPIPPDQIAPITEYLTKNFPEKAKPAGAVVPGPIKVSMKDWQVPTPGSRRTIRWRRETDRSGTPARWPMYWAASIRRAARSGNIR